MTFVHRTGADHRLEELARRARADLEMLNFATKPWVIPQHHDGVKLPDVVIIGAGQSGLVAGHALKRRGITNFLILDRNPEGYEGVWDTYARNYEIRSPKEITGADLGVPSLSIQSYYIAKHGADAWAAIRRVPRLDWMAYLRWYRQIADLPIENGVTIADIAYDAEGVSLTTDTGRVIRTRTVILATGMDGAGSWSVPEVISGNLPRGRYNHSCDIYDETRLRDLDVGLLGGGSGAFDTAVTALGAGAKTVSMFIRRAELPMLDPIREMEHAGALDQYVALSDRTKWGMSNFMIGLSQSPAEHHFYKACSYPNFRIYLGSPWESVGMRGDRIDVATPHDRHLFDHVFACTGVSVDMSLRPELARIAAKAALWRDRFTPPADQPSPGKLNFPYLGDCYQFTERDPGTAPGLDRIFAYNALSSLSMGNMSSTSISSHRFGVPRLVSGITRFLFREQQDHIVPQLNAYDTPGIELTAEVRARLVYPGRVLPARAAV